MHTVNDISGPGKRTAYRLQNTESAVLQKLGAAVMLQKLTRIKRIELLNVATRVRDLSVRRKWAWQDTLFIGMIVMSVIGLLYQLIGH